MLCFVVNAEVYLSELGAVLLRGIFCCFSVCCFRLDLPGSVGLLVRDLKKCKIVSITQIVRTPVILFLIFIVNKSFIEVLIGIRSPISGNKRTIAGEFLVGQPVYLVSLLACIVYCSSSLVFEVIYRFTVIWSGVILLVHLVQLRHACFVVFQDFFLRFLCCFVKFYGCFSGMLPILAFFTLFF